MEEELKRLLREEIKKEIEDLADLETGSQEQTKAVENLATLYTALLQIK